ncbi:hypothetical protein B0H16DRAFT_1729329 [Mycena metata]|uniref:HMG box domain-containing protein n=1 Tax=Mycena metata TaxID=1033252 RepID=A0AAD7IDS2_9AGAR|nr:hypothetical protein B0H16DRAFT_1729329 [Mycena metata]
MSPRIRRPQTGYMIFRSELRNAGQFDKRKTGDPRNYLKVAGERWAALSNSKKYLYFLKAEHKKLAYILADARRRRAPSVRLLAQIGEKSIPDAESSVWTSPADTLGTWEDSEPKTFVPSESFTTAMLGYECDDDILDSFFVLPSNSDIEPWFPRQCLLSAPTSFASPCFVEL